MGKKTLKTTNITRLEGLLVILKKREQTDAIKERIKNVENRISTVEVIPAKEYKIKITEEAQARKKILEEELARLKTGDI